jgi:hypothetical protein
MWQNNFLILKIGQHEFKNKNLENYPWWNTVENTTFMVTDARRTSRYKGFGVIVLQVWLIHF